MGATESTGADGHGEVWGRATVTPDTADQLEGLLARASDLDGYLYVELLRAPDGSIPGMSCAPQPGPFDDGLYGIYDNLMTVGYWHVEKHLDDLAAKIQLGIALVNGATRYWPVPGEASVPTGLALPTAEAIQVAMSTNVERQWYVCLDTCKWPIAGPSGHFSVYGPDMLGGAREWTLLRPNAGAMSILKKYIDRPLIKMALVVHRKGWIIGVYVGVMDDLKKKASDIDNADLLWRPFTGGRVWAASTHDDERSYMIQPVNY